MSIGRSSAQEQYSITILISSRTILKGKGQRWEVKVVGNLRDDGKLLSVYGELVAGGLRVGGFDRVLCGHSGGLNTCVHMCGG